MLTLVVLVTLAVLYSSKKIQAIFGLLLVVAGQFLIWGLLIASVLGAFK